VSGLRAEPRLRVPRSQLAHRNNIAGCIAARPPSALSIAEQDLLPAILDGERFADMAPAAVYATRLDEGCYHGSIRTMYRFLATRGLSGERRRQRVHPLYTMPKLPAIWPIKVWSPDVTKLEGPAK
jgi:putative transposase